MTKVQNDLRVTIMEEMAAYGPLTFAGLKHLVEIQLDVVDSVEFADAVTSLVQCNQLAFDPSGALETTH